MLSRPLRSACRARPWISDLHSKLPPLPQQLSQVEIQTRAPLRLDLQVCVEQTQMAVFLAICRPLLPLVPPALALPAWIGNRSLLQLNLPHPPAIKLAVTARMLHLMGIWHLFYRVQGGRCREAADVDAIVPVMLYFDFFVSISHVRLQCCT